MTTMPRGRTRGGVATRFDVIVGGASFAGLAVAAQLRGKRVLVLDHKPIGTHQTSACGTLVSTLRALGLEEAVLQVHDRLVIHTPGRDFVVPLGENPFCTFDYHRLCRLLWEGTDAEFIQAAVLGWDGDGARTSQGTFRGELIVDASGWRAVLGSERRPNLVQRNRLNFGLEAVATHEDSGLHFWFDPRKFPAMAIGWAFPSGEHNRIGIGSYVGESHLGPALDHFVADLATGRNSSHGGYFTHGLREPVIGDLFLVGDAAGQCMGLTGEGIRPALFFGTYLGRILRQVLDGESDLESVRHFYTKLVAGYSQSYRFMCALQRVLPRLPVPVVQVALAITCQPRVLRRVLRPYLGSFALPPTELPRANLREPRNAPNHD